MRGIKAILILLALAATGAISRAELIVNYDFVLNQVVPDNGQITNVQFLGGLATFTNSTVRLNLTSGNPGNPMFLGDLYSTLSYGALAESHRTAVLLNRPGRNVANAFG